LQQQVGTDNEDDAQRTCKVMKSHVTLIGSSFWKGQRPLFMVC
jgi:hypothetical protein